MLKNCDVNHVMQRICNFSISLYLYLDLPSAVKFVPFHPKNLPKGRNFTYLEDPGIYVTQMWFVVTVINFYRFGSWESANGILMNTQSALENHSAIQICTHQFALARFVDKRFSPKRSWGKISHQWIHENHEQNLKILEQNFINLFLTQNFRETSSGKPNMNNNVEHIRRQIHGTFILRFLGGGSLTARFSWAKSDSTVHHIIGVEKFILVGNWP